MPDKSPSGQPAIDLGQVVVRPIIRDEKEAFATLTRPMLAQIYQKGEVPQMRLNAKQTDSLFTFYGKPTC